MATNPALGANARGALSSAAALILVALLIDDGTVGLLVGVIAFILIAYAMTTIPVRYSMMGLTFFAIGLPNPSEGQPTPWEPPFSIVGKALLNHLNTVDRGGALSAVPVSGMELFFFALFLIIQRRKSTRSPIDGDLIPIPYPLKRLAYASLAASGFTWMYGLAFGGDFGMSLWQVNAVIYLPIIFLLQQAGLRGPEDHQALARVFLGAAVYKCLLAVYVVSTAALPFDPQTGTSDPPYATSHSDSMLFSICVVMVIAPILEGAGRPAWRRAAWLLPILFAGMIANNRRLVWVQVAIVLVIIYLLSKENPLKRFIRRTLLFGVPVGAIYIDAGWNSSFGRFFKPVRMLRSVVDAETDSSSQWREFENLNIIATFRDNPLLGTGYGHPYKEVVVLPAVDYSLERYIPHNSFLGLWAYAGFLGFAGLTLLWIGGSYFALRVYRNGNDMSSRATAAACFAVLPIYLTQCWGDLGLGTWTGIFMMGTSMSVAGKLAVATGQWRDQIPSR
jgi:hypothetical protein